MSLRIGYAGLALGCLVAGCAEDTAGFTASTTTTTASTGGGGASGGAGGEEPGGGGQGGEGFPCGIDCSTIETPPCSESICDLQRRTCVILDRAAGTPCDDGVFCTADDTCDEAGECISGPLNDCGVEPPDCQLVQCVEATRTCQLVPGPNGAACTGTDPCLLGGTCFNGFCTGGTPVDCSGTPVPNACHSGFCDSQNGQCVALPDPTKQGQSCVDADPCSVSETCDAMGGCAGPPKDCSALTQGCVVGTCNPANGVCFGQPVMNGDPCDDLDACTLGDVCMAGQCSPTTTIVQCADMDGCCPVGCNETTDDDCVRPNLMVCGFTSKPVLDFAPPNTSFNVINACTPNDTVQALFVTRNFNNALNALQVQTYLQNGGIVLTEWNVSDDVFSLVFGAVAQGPTFLGACTDCFPLVQQFSPNDPFWQDNTFVAQPLSASGCGYSVAAFPGITPISGWNAVDVAVAYRDLGAGRLWLTDFDWQDNEMYPCQPGSEVLVGYMMTHK
jgi:hypothetical protein